MLKCLVSGSGPFVVKRGGGHCFNTRRSRILHGGGCKQRVLNSETREVNVCFLIRFSWKHVLGTAFHSGNSANIVGSPLIEGLSIWNGGGVLLQVHFLGRDFLLK